jgi:hypothetical protein
MRDAIHRASAARDRLASAMVMNTVRMAPVTGVRREGPGRNGTAGGTMRDDPASLLPTERWAPTNSMAVKNLPEDGPR